MRERERERDPRLSYRFSTRISISASHVCNYHSQALHLLTKKSMTAILTEHKIQGGLTGAPLNLGTTTTHWERYWWQSFKITKDWLCCVWAIHVLRIQGIGDEIPCMKREISYYLFIFRHFTTISNQTKEVKIHFYE